jgi:biopolymer transport protein ExbD
MTPMIDVVFLLLIFFICAAAGQVKEAVLSTEMASTGAISNDQSAERDPWVVDIWLRLEHQQEETTVNMNGTDYSPVVEIEQPLRLLGEVSPENPVILQVAGSVPMADVIAVYDLCESAGFESINFAARAEDLQDSAAGRR